MKLKFSKAYMLHLIVGIGFWWNEVHLEATERAKQRDSSTTEPDVLYYSGQASTTGLLREAGNIVNDTLHNKIRMLKAL